MARTKWIDHMGKRIFFIDFSNTNYAGIRETVEEAKPIISAQSKNSILCLVDTTGTKFALDISKDVKDFTMHNKPYMKMTALIGLEGIQKVILNTAMVFTKRENFVLKNSYNEAMDFLALLD